MNRLPTIAIAAGDPAGIGPEISVKAALDAAVRKVCKPVVICDRDVMQRHIAACGIDADLHVIARLADADWSGDPVNLLDCAQPEAAELALGTPSAAGGRAALAFARTAIKAALAGDAAAVIAAPQNETAIALAGVPFDGYPSFVARETEADPNDVYLMLCFGETRIVHCTLHMSVRTALDLITRERILRVIRATARALERLGI